MLEQLHVTGIDCQTSRTFAFHFVNDDRTSYTQIFIVGSTVQNSNLALPGENHVEVSISLVILNYVHIYRAARMFMVKISRGK